MTNITRRENIQKIIGSRFNPKNVNTGLWLDKFIYDSQEKGKSEAAILQDADKKEETAKTALVNQVVQIQTPEIYKKFFNKTWLPNLHDHGAICKKATVKNRLAINLGSESVLETNIALHRIFGVPFIPGSALKGLVAHFLQNYGGDDWNETSQNYITIFGNQEKAGFITFHDALLFVPKDGNSKHSLCADVMTTHHPDYYAPNNRTIPPADWDNPNPVPFISATGDFLIAVSGPNHWVELTFQILKFALQDEGIGAKTSSGYGRMYFSGDILSDEQIEAAQADQFSEIFNKLEILVNADRDTRKTTNKEIKVFLKGIEDAEKKKEVAGKLYKKAKELEIAERLEETNTQWFKWVIDEK
ncbi:MAG: type III-B CRISPR module RAMP protein Cmr6 [Pyrinomonadaceae bacterium]